MVSDLFRKGQKSVPVAKTIWAPLFSEFPSRRTIEFMPAVTVHRLHDDITHLPRPRVLCSQGYRWSSTVMCQSMFALLIWR